MFTETIQPEATSYFRENFVKPLEKQEFLLRTNAHKTINSADEKSVVHQDDLAMINIKEQGVQELFICGSLRKYQLKTFLAIGNPITDLAKGKKALFYMGDIFHDKKEELFGAIQFDAVYLPYWKQSLFARSFICDSDGNLLYVLVRIRLRYGLCRAIDGFLYEIKSKQCLGELDNSWTPEIAKFINNGSFKMNTSIANDESLKILEDAEAAYTIHMTKGSMFLNVGRARGLLSSCTTPWLPLEEIDSIYKKKDGQVDYDALSYRALQSDIHLTPEITSHMRSHKSAATHLPVYNPDAIYRQEEERRKQRRSLKAGKEQDDLKKREQTKRSKPKEKSKNAKKTKLDDAYDEDNSGYDGFTFNAGYEQPRDFSSTTPQLHKGYHSRPPPTATQPMWTAPRDQINGRHFQFGSYHPPPPQQQPDDPKHPQHRSSPYGATQPMWTAPRDQINGRHFQFGSYNPPPPQQQPDDPKPPQHRSSPYGATQPMWTAPRDQINGRHFQFDSYNLPPPQQPNGFSFPNSRYGKRRENAHNLQLISLQRREIALGERESERALLGRMLSSQSRVMEHLNERHAVERGNEAARHEIEMSQSRTYQERLWSFSYPRLPFSADDDNNYY